MAILAVRSATSKASSAAAIRGASAEAVTALIETATIQAQYNELIANPALHAG